MSDPSLLRLALTTRAPQTKEELFWFFKEIVQVPCAPCGNTGKVMFPKVGICRTCGGLGKRGFHFGRKAICADHSAPLDILAELWFGTLRHVLIIANREGGKTQMLALLSHLMMHFGRYSIAHMGSVESQAFRARDYLQAILGLEPWKKSIQGQMSQSQATLTNGAKIEWLTGTLAQACLPGSTRIITDIGLFDMREIVSKKLKVRVKSFNFNRQRIEWQPITAWHDNGAEEQFRMIVVDSGLTLIATGNHLIPQPDGRKVELEWLYPGEFVCQAAQADLFATKIRYVGNIRLEGERRYDLTVAENHNYCTSSGILVGNSGVHPELSILDECDQADPDVRQRFLKTPSGPRSCFIEASTHYIQMGTISQILRESPNLPVRRFCLHGDTKISTSSGDLAIRDMVGKENLWVYCSHNGKLALRQARDIRKTRENAPVVKVTFGWSSFLRDERFVGSVIATPDHQFLLKDGSWKEAQDLQPKDRLTPFYRKHQPSTSWMPGWDVGLGGEKLVREHRFIFEQVHRPLQPGEVVHHRNHDRWDNTPENLIALSDSEHRSYHQKMFAQDDERELQRSERLRENRKQSGSPWNAEVNRRAWANATPEARALRVLNIKRGQQRAKEKRELQVSENHRVISVEPAGTADVYCMDVPGSENFVANGVIVHNCLWESLAQCDYDCEKMPQLDGKLARCALYESIEHTADGRMQVVPLCGGTIARQCDGHIDVIHAQMQWAKSDPWSRRVEYLCEPPDRPVGGRAYWNYHSAQNRLNFNPDIQPNKPLEWTMDFGPGVGARMCSTILQTSPDGTEDWIVDEIVLGTSSTSEVIKEFLRRYGPHGCIAPQHSGGIWIYGDRSGHTRASTTGDTDYDLIIAALRNTPGFRLLVFSGDANPPLIDRLNLVNRLLCDETGRRRLKVAQKCKETARELELMPLGADRKKDKSDKVQRVLGLSHIGDGIEYWAWKKYGRSGMVMGDNNLKIAPVVALGNVRRESSILVSRSGRRSSMDK